MKQFASLLIAVAIMAAYAVPVAAQQDTVTLDFRVTVNVDCPNATYWGFFGPPNSDAINYVQLTDDDGDGVYTGTATPEGGRLVVQVIQGTGSRELDSELFEGTLTVPGEPQRVIRDFGEEQADAPTLVPHLVIDEDMTFEASVSSCPSGLPGTGLLELNPLLPLAGGMLLLATGMAVRRRVWDHV